MRHISLVVVPSRATHSLATGDSPWNAVSFVVESISILRGWFELERIRIALFSRNSRSYYESK